MTTMSAMLRRNFIVQATVTMTVKYDRNKFIVQDKCCHLDIYLRTILFHVKETMRLWHRHLFKGTDSWCALPVLLRMLALLVAASKKLAVKVCTLNWPTSFVLVDFALTRPICLVSSISPLPVLLLVEVDFLQTNTA